tara:strand:+ start:820 stop:978 length:159 start_codon:yes stop_codon:yes gene_type:complete
MFNLFKKDPKEKLQKQYEELMKKATEAQRKGDIDLYSRLSSEAEEVGKKLDQ